MPSDAPTIVYSNRKVAVKGISIYSHSLLTEDVIYAQDIKVMTDMKRPYFLHSYGYKGDYHFDLFSMIFYLLTRYEEYLRFHPDKYGRFSVKQSLAYRNEFLDCPLVDFWILDLKQKIEEKWSLKIPLNRSFRIEPSIDIDTPYAYKNRSVFAHLGATIRDIFLLRGERLTKRMSTLLGKEKDVFDTYDYIFKRLNQYGLSAKFFFLMQCRLPDDQNFSVNSKAFKNLVKFISDKHKIGIHPSLNAQISNRIWKKEKNKLELYSFQKPTKSRQHFLHLTFPKTYQHLISEGIQEDYSMAYHDCSGFRASTAIPYPWYDLKKEKVSELIIHPAVIMDATLRYHMSLNVESAKAEVVKMKVAVQQVEGVFSFIWHNSSFAEIYGWDGWGEVFEECLK